MIWEEKWNAWFCGSNNGKGWEEHVRDKRLTSGPCWEADPWKPWPLKDKCWGGYGTGDNKLRNWDAGWYNLPTSTFSRDGPGNEWGTLVPSHVALTVRRNGYVGTQAESLKQLYMVSAPEFCRGDRETLRNRSRESPCLKEVLAVGKQGRATLIYWRRKCKMGLWTHHFSRCQRDKEWCQGPDTTHTHDLIRNKLF